ncbi:MAG: DUF58 domain-containing protein [Verrucomicrobiae bacterium]|nr:DUF58 domain-containing protein [Verrucomicrobiae bacterium]
MVVSFDSEFLKKLEYLFLVSRRIFRGQLRSERRSRAVGASVEFADYRNYILGDDLRYIDWNAYGRINRLFIKLFEEEEDLHIYLLVDVSRSMRFGQPSKLDYAKRVAAALAYIGLASLDRVDVLYFGGQMEGQMGMSRGKGQIHKVLQFLERDPEPRNPVTSFHSALLNFVHQNKHRGLAVVLSDFFDPDFESGIRLLQYHKFDVCLLQVLDPIDLDPSLLGDFRLIDGESGLGREVTVNEDLLVRYRRTVREFNDRINRFATQRQISYLRTATTTPFDELVLKLLRQGKFVA